MKAAMYDEFGGPVTIRNVPDPTPSNAGVVLQVKATGLCRSDWHGWVGHDPDIKLPHIPGHEIAGIVKAAGADVKKWDGGERVTLPFSCGCGACPQCESGNHQICDNYFQPGFTAWGSFAEYVALDYADVNLVRLPDEIDFITAASLGCRFVTSFRGIVDQGKVAEGQWVAVHGCGGVGLSAVMIAQSLGAHVIAVDIDDEKLRLAKSIGAAKTINATKIQDVVTAVKEISGGGAHVSVDALGNTETCFNSIANLRKRGKHIQIGVMAGKHSHPPVPMDLVMFNELEILGSHGMQAYRYEGILEMIRQGRLQPARLIGKTISLEKVPDELTNMDSFKSTGVTVVTEF